MGTRLLGSISRSRYGCHPRIPSYWLAHKERHREDIFARLGEWETAPPVVSNVNGNIRAMDDYPSLYPDWLPQPEEPGHYWAAPSEQDAQYFIDNMVPFASLYYDPIGEEWYVYVPDDSTIFQ